MKTYVFFLLAIVLLIIASCQARKEADLGSVDAIETSNPLVSGNKPVEVPERDLYTDGKSKLIKTANYRFQVENVKKSTEAIEQAIKKYPAYISTSNLHLENPILENKLTIRVQSEYFYSLLKDIDSQARFVNFRNVETADVEKEFVDLESRINTKREVEARYIEILRKKTGTIEALLKAEEQIGTLHEDIEACIARVNFLKDQVRYSTINLEFYQTILQELKAGDTPSLADKFTKALLTGWHGMLNVLLAAAYVWPLLILSVAITVFLKTRRRRMVLDTGNIKAD